MRKFVGGGGITSIETSQGLVSRFSTPRVQGEEVTRLGFDSVIFAANNSSQLLHSVQTLRTLGYSSGNANFSTFLVKYINSIVKRILFKLFCLQFRNSK